MSTKRKLMNIKAAYSSRTMCESPLGSSCTNSSGSLIITPGFPSASRNHFFIKYNHGVYAPLPVFLNEESHEQAKGVPLYPLLVNASKKIVCPEMRATVTPKMNTFHIPDTIDLTRDLLH